ncbi:hypothetical protein [Paenibacillus ginsengihumi]|uniref:hypothetical protein n=1 Tax=Paenibacillus ginsengihumi TaxID=431596 RepID=UPI00036D6DC7|nr:hypothetical protein [Paenibacillus ginsengihumi]
MIESGREQGGSSVQREITKMIENMAVSQTEMAKIIAAERHTAVHMAQLVHDIPPHNPGFGGIEELMGNSLAVTKNVAAYLNSLADLEDTLADHLSYLLKEVNIPEGEE